MSGTKVVRLGGEQQISSGAATGRRPAQQLSTPPEAPGIDAALELGPAQGRYRDDTTFLPAALAILESPPSRAAIVLSWSLAALVIVAVLLSFVTHTTIYAEAPGAVLASGGTKVVQSQEGGNVAKISVRDGQHVNAGDVLITLDPTDAQANQALVAAKLAEARGRGIRLRAELAAIRADTLVPPPPIAWTDGIPDPVRAREAEVMRGDLARLAATFGELDAQRHAKEAARDGFAASIGKEQALIDTSTEHEKMHETLAGIGVESQFKMLEGTLVVQHQQVDLAALRTNAADAAAAIVRVEAQRVKARSVLLDQNQLALADSDQQSDDLSQQLVRASQRVTDMTLLAPIGGTVAASAITTPGQVARPGEQLMQVVPDGAPLRIEAYILNTDIGFVRTGQPATIKVDTFPYTRYGVLHGTVRRVSVDAIPGKQALMQQKDESTAVVRGSLSATAAAQRMGDLVFPITIEPSETSIVVDGRKSPLLPGMSVVVEVETQKQPVIAWVLYPLMRGKTPPS